jgi:hypothetical protein
MVPQIEDAPFFRSIEDAPFVGALVNEVISLQ